MFIESLKLKLGWKILLFISFITLINLNHIKFYYFKFYKTNPKVKVINADQFEYKTYQDILNLYDLNKPTLLYFNTRFSYESLEQDTVILRQLENSYINGKINLIYMAISLDCEDEYREWFENINNYDLIGDHYYSKSSFDKWNYNNNYTQDNGLPGTIISKCLIINNEKEIIDTIYKRLSEKNIASLLN